MTGPERRGLDRLAIGLGLITALSWVLVAPSVVWAMASLMALQAPPSVMMRLYVWTSLSAPLALIAGPITAWIAYALGRRGPALGLGLAPALWLLVIGLCLASRP